MSTSRITRAPVLPGFVAGYDVGAIYRRGVPRNFQALPREVRETLIKFEDELEIWMESQELSSFRRKGFEVASRTGVTPANNPNLFKDYDAIPTQSRRTVTPLQPVKKEMEEKALPEGLAETPPAAAPTAPDVKAEPVVDETVQETRDVMAALEEPAEQDTAMDMSTDDVRPRKTGLKSAWQQQGPMMGDGHSRRGRYTGIVRPKWPTVVRPYTKNTRAHIVGNRPTGILDNQYYAKDLIGSHTLPPFLSPHAVTGQRGSEAVVGDIRALQAGSHHWLFGQ